MLTKNFWAGQGMARALKPRPFRPSAQMSRVFGGPTVQRYWAGQGVGRGIGPKLTD